LDFDLALALAGDFQIFFAALIFLFLPGVDRLAETGSTVSAFSRAFSMYPNHQR